MIDELTKEQQLRIRDYVTKGLKIGLETQPNGIENPEEIKELVHVLYRAHGKEAPKTIEFYDSPMAAKRAIAERDGVKLQWKWDFIAGSQELYWLYFYQFINEELPVKKTDLPLKETIDLCERVGWFFPYENYCAVTPKPAELHMKQGRLHCEHGPAIQFRDGYSLYALNGVRFTGEEHWIKQPVNELNPADILNIKNVEQRAEVIKLFGIDKLFTQLNPTLLNSKDSYELYSVPIYEDMPRIYLKMNNPSVDEIHIEAVHPDCKNVDQALSWRNFGTIDLDFVPPLVLT